MLVKIYYVEYTFIKKPKKIVFFYCMICLTHKYCKKILIFNLIEATIVELESKML